MNEIDHFHFDAIYHSLLRVVRAFMFVDEQGNIFRADPMISEITGYSNEDLRSLSIFQIDNGLTEDGWKKRWKDLQQHGRIQYASYWRTAKDKMVPVFLLACPLTNGRRTFAVYKVHLSTVNILFPLLQHCAKLSKSAGWEWNMEKQRFFVTDSFFDIFELDPANFNPREMTILTLLKKRLDVRQLEVFSNHIAQLRKGESSIDWTWEIDTTSGPKRIWMNIQAVNDDKQERKIRGFLQLIKQPGETEHLAELLIDKSERMICWIKRDGRLIYANKAMEQALGYKKQDLIHNLKIQQIDIEHSANDWNNLWAAGQAEASPAKVTSFQRKNGTVFPVEMDIIILKEDTLGLIAQDISSLRQQEVKLNSGLLQFSQESQQLEAENLYLQDQIAFPFENIISQSKKYAEVLQQIRQVAPTNATVLIEGESGTGKELLAHALHRLSLRSERPLVKVNCAALPENLIESELFGHEKGAFTGAHKKRLGRFELADKGTIFLDEIGEIPLDVQTKLLRVLQEGEFERVGGSETISVNVRIIAATNRKLKAMVEQKKFREDLYYRLHVFPIENLALRERTEDIALLAKHFLQKFKVRIGKDIESILPEDLERLTNYTFPGNVRELENIIERAVILTNGPVLDLSHWKPEQLFSRGSSTTPTQKTMEQMQYDLIIDTLEKTDWRVSGDGGAAELLDMHPQTLYSRMRKLGIKKPR